MKYFRAWMAVTAAMLSVVAWAATPTSNIPISQMPTATNVLDGAYVPIIQPYPGRATNDNFKAAVSTIFTGRGALSVTNLYVTTEIVTNLYVTNLTVLNLTILGDTNGFGQLWTNKARIYEPTFTNTSTIVVGQSAEAWFVPTVDDGLVIVHDRNAGDSIANSLQIMAADDASDPSVTLAFGGFGVNVGSSNNFLGNPYGHLALSATSDYQGFGGTSLQSDVNPVFGTLTLQSIDNATQDNFGRFLSSVSSDTAPAGSLLLFSSTNNSNPSAPYSKFQVDIQPAYGEVLMDFMNNGVHEFAVSNQITSVQALQLVPITNATLALGANQINVQSNSFISLESLDPDPTLTTISLSTGLRDGMVLILKNVGVGRGFTLLNGSPLYDNPAKFVTLPGGTWISANYGDSMLLAGGLNGWTEVKRWGQNTNVQTEQLWELVSGHMRTTGDTTNDWQFRYGGVPQLTVSSNGGVYIGSSSNISMTPDGYININGSGGFGEVQLNGSSAGSMIDIYNDDTIALIQFQSPLNGIMRTAFLSPTQSEGSPGISAPYWFGTIETYTNSLLWGIYNGTNSIINGTPTLSFGPDARITLTNIDAIFANSDEGFSFSWRSNTVLTISTNSGYSGTGANWFADDGKFHAAPGGGDVVGTLTSPKVPYATGAHAVADSNIEVANVNPARMWLFDDQTLSVPTGQIGTYTQPFSYLYLYNLIWGDGGSLHGKLYDGIYNANPEGVLTADVGSLLRVTNGSPGSVLYVKETGLNTSSGWSPVLTTSSGTLSITNGIVQRVKESFSTNYVIGSNTNHQFFLLNGTNQLITLPEASGVKDIIYRFSMTNGLGSFVITNAADGAKIRDGVSLSYTNIGVNEVGFISDGSNWWLASKGKQIFPSASWSLGNTISPVQDVITNIPFTQLEFNNSQGIALRTKSGFTGATELAITNAGTYLITFSAVLKGSGPGTVISIWLRKDGSDVARTRTDQAFTSSSAQQCMTVNYFVQVGTSVSYFELCAASHDASPPTIVSAAANPTGYTAPAMPGVIVTINRVSDTWP